MVTEALRLASQSLIGLKQKFLAKDRSKSWLSFSVL